MKKILIIALAFVISICFSACGNNDTQINSDITSSQSQIYVSEETDTSTQMSSQNDIISSSTNSVSTPIESKNTTTSNTTASTENTTSNHIHSYSKATCTAPAKCSCGSTEGSVLEHKYDNFVCTLCGFKDEKGIAIATNPKLSFKPKLYRTYNFDERGEIYDDDGKVLCICAQEIWLQSDGSIALSRSYCIPAIYALTELHARGYTDDEINSWPIDTEASWASNFYTIYNGTKYLYVGGAGDGQDGWKYELTDTEIIVSSQTEVKIKFKMDVEGNLIVTYSTQKETGDSGPTFNVGDICK